MNEDVLRPWLNPPTALYIFTFVIVFLGTHVRVTGHTSLPSVRNNKSIPSNTSSRFIEFVTSVQLCVGIDPKCYITVSPNLRKPVLDPIVTHFTPDVGPYVFSP